MLGNSEYFTLSELPFYTIHLNFSNSSSSSFYFLNVKFFNAQLGLDVCHETKPLQISLNTAHSDCKLSSFMSSFTHSLHVFLPSHFSPATSTLLQADIHSYTSVFRCPNHLNLPSLTTSATLHFQPHFHFTFLILHFLSFNDTPHIHITIICTVFSKLCRFPAFTAAPPMSQFHVNIFCTQALYIFPFMW